MRSASGMVRKTKRAIGIAGLILIGLGAAMTPPIALSQESQRTAAHPKIANPASLEGEQAESVYQAIRESLRRNYANSGEPEAVAYQSWKRFNAVPYRSPNHGERFVNHYGNDKASEYGKYEDLQPMPQGAIVIKDSFLVTRQGVLKTGPLFVMEKMGPASSRRPDIGGSGCCGRTARCSASPKAPTPGTCSSAPSATRRPAPSTTTSISCRPGGG